MTTLIATWGGASSNSYVTLTWAEDFIGTTVVSTAAWDAADSRQQTAALMQAAIDIDSRQYLGARKYVDQRLEFPRALPVNALTSKYVESATALSTAEARMQDDVQRAQAFQAVWILQNSGRNLHAELSAAGVKEVTKEVGPIRESYKYGGVGGGVAQTSLCPKAQQLLSSWLSGRRVIRA